MRKKATYKKPKNSNQLTTKTCVICSKHLRASEAALSDVCTSCLNPIKTKPIEIINGNKDCFEMERKIISFMGMEYEYVIFADKMFNPIVEILTADKVCIYYGNSAETPEGESVFAFLLSKNIVKKHKDGNNKIKWS